jgi:hypothetical protein
MNESNIPTMKYGNLNGRVAVNNVDEQNTQKKEIDI